MAGVIARSDLEQGVHHAPVRERLRGLSSDADGRSVEFAFGPAEVDTLSRLGVNAIGNDERGQSPCLLTAIKTSTDEQSRSIATQRLLAFIRNSIEQRRRLAKSELEGKALRDRLNRDITAFLESVWSSGALLGKTPQEAFFVRCDEPTTTRDNIDNGRVVCTIQLTLATDAATVVAPITIQSGVADESTGHQDSSDESN